MNNKLFVISAGLLASSQVLAWGDFLGDVLQNAAQQAASNAVNQAVAPGQPQPPQAVGQPQAAQVPGVVYGANGCVQNVPAGPPGTHADADGNGCVSHLEYANYVSYLANNAPQYLGAGTTVTSIPPQSAPASVEGQAAGAAVQGLMGLFGR